MQGQGGALAWKRNAAWSGQGSGPESGPGLPAAFRANKRSRLDEDGGSCKSWQEAPAGCNGGSGSWDAASCHGQAAYEPAVGGDSSWSGHCDSSSSSWAAAPSGGGGGGCCGGGGGGSWDDVPGGGYIGASSSSVGGGDGQGSWPGAGKGGAMSWAGGDWSSGATSDSPQQSPPHRGPPEAAPRQWQQAGAADPDGAFGTMQQQLPWQPPGSQDSSAGWGQPSMQQAPSHQPDGFDQQHAGLLQHPEEHGGAQDPSQPFYEPEGGYTPEQMRQWQLWQSWGQARAKGSSAAGPLNFAFHGTNVLPTQSQEEQLTQGEGKRYLGRIKRFFGGKASGYGFIDCPEARHRFGYDVYLHAKQMHGCEVGEFVSFTIVRNAKGEPQARNLVRAVEAANVEAKRQAEIIKQQEMLQAKRGGNMFSGVTGGGGMEMDEEAARKFQESLKSRRL